MEEITKVTRRSPQKSREAAEDLQQLAENQSNLLEKKKQLGGVESKIEAPVEGPGVSNKQVSSLGIAEAQDILTAWKPDEFLARISAAGPGEDSTQTLSAVLSESKKRISDFLKGPGSSEIVYMMTTMLEYTKMLADRMKEKQKQQAEPGQIPGLVTDGQNPAAGDVMAELVEFSKNIFQELSQRPNEDTVTLTERFNTLLSWLNDRK